MEQWAVDVLDKANAPSRAVFCGLVLVAISGVTGCGRVGFEDLTESDAVRDESDAGDRRSLDGGPGLDAAGTTDGGTIDAAPPILDGGSDSSTGSDSGGLDAGPDDAGGLDAGAPDSGGGTDAGSPLNLTNNSTEIVVTSPGNFEIAFVAAQAWQPTRWRDFTATGSANLAGLTNGQRKHEVLASPIGILTGISWLTINEADMSSASAMQIGPDEVLVTTNFRMTGNVVWNVQAEYRLRSTGRIEATVTVTAPTVTAVDGFEFAYTNLDPAYGWMTTISGDSQSFQLEATTGSAPRPALTTRAIAPTMASRVSSDALGNRYFQTDASFSIGPATPFVVTWELDL